MIHLLFTLFSLFLFRFIQFALGIYTRSPKAYASLKRNMLMPSQSLLMKYKNYINQQPGVNPTHLDWMCLEAERRGVSDAGRSGCLAIDEMKIEVSHQ